MSSLIEVDKTWSFEHLTSKQTSYLTHGYYTYPAKFIPQIAQRLILENSKEGDTVIDPFCGSGTTIVESILNKRKGIGVDINEIAVLVSKVKTTPIEPNLLNKEITNLYLRLNKKLTSDNRDLLKQFFENNQLNIERINYWFSEEIKNKLALLLSQILEISNDDVRDFLLVNFSQILKPCSYWMQKSIKPTRDLGKTLSDPIKKFFEFTKKMIKSNSEFYRALDIKVKEQINEYRIVKCTDARNLPCEDGIATLIVTSPPYVTSYEYADLHQLPLLWLGYLKELKEYRKKYIGSAGRDRLKIDLKSKLAEHIIANLTYNKKAKEVENYYADMLEAWLEVKRVLKPKGKACIVIGNTYFGNIEVANAQVFVEQMENIGFKTHKIIQRDIPSKFLPSTRDAAGRFAKVTNAEKIAYPTEFILIMEKP